tara:strand:- start:569 stop:721 length:153 start_codon:yes stop_codon:yes gene_type:complete
MVEMVRAGTQNIVTAKTAFTKIALWFSISMPFIALSISFVVSLIVTPLLI